MSHATRPARRPRAILATTFATATVAMAASASRAGVPDDPITLSLATPLTPAATTPATPAAFEPFAIGTWSLDAVANGTWSLGTGPIDSVGGSVGAAYAFRDGVQVAAELQGDALYDGSPQDDGFGVGFNVRFRFRLFEVGAVTCFADVAAGVLQTSVSIPDDGSHFNFRETGGLGAYVPINGDVLLITGVHFEHISNAGIAEGDNPGYNGVQFYVGVTVPL